MDSDCELEGKTADCRDHKVVPKEKPNGRVTDSCALSSYVSKHAMTSVTALVNMHAGFSHFGTYHRGITRYASCGV